MLDSKVERERLVRIELKQYENMDRAERQLNREQRKKRDREQKGRICASLYTTLKYKIDDIF